MPRDISEIATEVAADLGEELDTGAPIGENEESYPSDLDEGDFDEGMPADEEASQGFDPEEPLADGEPHADLGGAESLDLGGPLGSVPSPDLPPPPQGFDSWTAFEKARERQAALNYHEQQRQYQLAQQAQQQQAQQPEGFQWQLPHTMTPDLQLAMQLRGTDSYKTLDPVQQQRASEQHGYVSANWNRWTYDPNQHVDDVVMPRVMPLFQRMNQEIAQLKAAAFRRQNEDVLGKPQQIQRYLQISQEFQADPHQAALRFARLEHALEEAQRSGQKQQTKSRDRQAATQSARGKPAHKTRSKGRRGKKAHTIEKAKRAQPSAASSWAIQELLDRGEISPSDLT